MMMKNLNAEIIKFNDRIFHENVEDYKDQHVGVSGTCAKAPRFHKLVGAKIKVQTIKYPNGKFKTIVLNLGYSYMPAK